MFDTLGYETFSESHASGAKAGYVDADYGYGEENCKKYTIMTKQKFINYIKAMLSAFNIGGVSLLEEANVPTAIKRGNVSVPPWVHDHCLDYNVEASHDQIRNYLSDVRAQKIFVKDYSNMISPEFTESALKTEAAMLDTHFLSGSVAIASYLMRGYASDPLYGNKLGEPDRNKRILANMEFQVFSLSASNAVSEAVLSVDYLNKTLEGTKNLKEEEHTFFIDDKNIPVVMRTVEFISKYLTADDSI